MSTYWASRPKSCEPRDVGHVCKECKKPFTRVGEHLMVRRGGRIELRYHAGCFSGSDDPRTQEHSSFNTTQLGAQVRETAPSQAFRKMRTSSQF
jgi:hypothetical protein